MLIMRKETSRFGQTATPTVANPVVVASPTTSLSTIWTSLGTWRYLVAGLAAWYVYKMWFKRT